MKIALITLSLLFLPFSIFSQVKGGLQLQGDAIYYNYDLTVFEIFENQVKIGNFNKNGYFAFDTNRKHSLIVRHPDFVETILDSVSNKVIVLTEISENTKNRLTENFQKEQLATCDQSLKTELNSIIPDTIAQFPGGRASLSQYLGENIRYPEYCIDKNIQGKVYVSFVVEENGYITCIKIEKSVNYFLDKEAFRCVKDFPKFEPARLNGKPIATIYRLPITFKMN